MSESFLKGKKTLWVKEKLLVTSNFSFSHSVFKRHVLQASKKQGLVWARVKPFGTHEAELMNSFDVMALNNGLCKRHRSRSDSIERRILPEVDFYTVHLCS